MDTDNQNKIKSVRIAIDRGGTFTDCYASWEEWNESDSVWKLRNHVIKLLSQDPMNYSDAPSEGIRRLLSYIESKTYPRNEKIPISNIEALRMGTTVATNALLERQGARLALITTKGFGDSLEIGYQNRPEIFDLTCGNPNVLYEAVVEVDERVTVVDEKWLKRYGPKMGLDEMNIKVVKTGEKIWVEKELDLEVIKNRLQQLLDEGINCLAICFLHSYLYPDHELKVSELAKLMGFQWVTLSSELMPMVKLIPRTHSGCADAYLTPHIQAYLKSFKEEFSGDPKELDKKLLFMQSDGGLTPSITFSGFRGILSGPAGGVVGYAQTCYDFEDPRARAIIGFDMGGTSTDVSRFSGTFAHTFETVTAGISILAPQLDIQTVAAGGGSKLMYSRGLLQVGPQSVGAHPGPACYGVGDELAITDANLVLGRLIPEYFPKIFGPNENAPLNKERSYRAFEKIHQQIKAEEGKNMTVEEIALGFVQVANEAMCRPIRALTESKGFEPKTHILCSFGGAGGQHACALASALGIDTVLVHRHASILSAYGLSLAEVVEEAQEPAASSLDQSSMPTLEKRVNELIEHACSKLKGKGFTEDAINKEIFMNLRYQGTDCQLMVKVDKLKLDNIVTTFLQNHKMEFGFLLSDRPILVDDLRVRATGAPSKDLSRNSVYREAKELEIAGYLAPPPSKGTHPVFFEGGERPTEVFFLSELKVGTKLVGPALIIEPNSTTVLEPGWQALITTDHLYITALQPSEHTEPKSYNKIEVSNEPDPVKLSIFSNRFMSIAEQMGRTLQKTSVSTNIKERLDFSCALFGPDGGLIANAPHIPVHLGALSFAVKWQMDYYNELSKTKPSEALKDGDVLVTNHPSAGGSHLPDITVITPVFHKGKIVFFTASRGHHADIGGILPGSMPPHSKSLAQEGASILSFKLVRNGVFQTEGITKILVDEPPQCDPASSGTRCLADNLSDLKAQVAANYKGIQLVHQLIEQEGLDTVHMYMRFIRSNAERAVRTLLKKMIPEGQTSVELSAIDHMDDGSPIQLKVNIQQDGSAIFDFEGTGNQVYGNFNAPLAITHSAILYCLRCLIADSIPLNEGCLSPLKIHVPLGSLLNPGPNAAVVGGNVTTSQRICDVIFKAFKACAASQGCCNNLTFGRTKKAQVNNNEDDSDGWGYYETIAGGSGAGPHWKGRSGVHTHMTNTRITDPEILERRYPVILREFSIRQGSGGKGINFGGNGVIRTLEFLEPLEVSILSERRSLSPYGLNGGRDGLRGLNLLIKKQKDNNDKNIIINLGGKATVQVNIGDAVSIQTPGGGGFGFYEEQ